MSWTTYVDGAKEYNDRFTGLIPGIESELRFGKQKSSGFDALKCNE